MTRFEWDPIKAVTNLQKHGISFEEAASAFSDNLGLVLEDRIIDGERRFHLIARTTTQIIVLVAHTVSGDNHEEIIRIISARRVTRKERAEYEEGHNAF